jgi:hypothetical protein
MREGRRANPDERAGKTVSQVEVVTLAVYVLGGESAQLDTEDIAIKANEFAPGRFASRKYPTQINLELIWA